MFTSLAGASVIVTGATRGIGLGIARRFGAVGARVLVVSRKLDDAEAIAAEIGQAGGTALGFAANVAVKADAEAMAKAAVDAFGGIDILCANAGIFPVAALAEMTEADFDHVLDTNLKGTFLSLGACLPALKQSGAGRIVMTSSITGPLTGLPGMAHYGASKAGQLGLMRAAAVELAPFGITVNAVLPGSIMTAGLADLGEAHLAKMVATIPLKRLGGTEDIANAVLYFATREAAYVTGQTIIVDGGQTLLEGGVMEIQQP